MRQASEALAVPLRTVTHAYKTLEQEGLLIRIRGSRTVLRGNTHKRKQANTFTVGVPIWLEGFSHFQYRRDILMNLSDDLCHHSIATDPVFFRGQEDFSYRFIDRLLSHQLDACLWIQPVHWHYNLINTVKDHGIQNIILTDAELEFLPSQSIVDRTEAYQTVFRDWTEKRGIEEIIVIHHGSHTPQRLDCLQKAVSGIPLKWTLRNRPSRRLAQKGNTATVILDQVAAIRLVHDDPGLFLQLARIHPILFARDCPIIPYPVPEVATVDIIRFPTQPICRDLTQLILKGLSDSHYADSKFYSAEIELQANLRSLTLPQ
ncbi:MAG: hypothetical protein ACQKBT_03580 [Puniceicoccales bacterium]